jgi:methylitaconate Delta-isomerase
VFFDPRDLPGGRDAMARVLLDVMGSPDPRQIDGLGGAKSLTSKVAIVSRSGTAGAEVDYLFAQVDVSRPIVDWNGTCGNILAGVGPYSIDRGLVPAREPVTTVRIRLVNTGKIVLARVPTTAGRPDALGECVIDGVPGCGAEIRLKFLDPGGSHREGALLPTGHPRDYVHVPGFGRVEVSLVDAANPVVFVRAEDVGLRGGELPGDFADNERICVALETIRGTGAQWLGLARAPEDATHQSPGLPKIAIVAKPLDYATIDGKAIAAESVDLVARLMTMQRPHTSYMVTGAIATGAAAAVKETIVAQVVRSSPHLEGPRRRLRIGHPSGVLRVWTTVGPEAEGARVESVELNRTARILMDGWVRVSARHFQPESSTVWSSALAAVGPV